MPVDFGDVVFTLRNIRVARLLASGAYDTNSFSLTHGLIMSFEVVADMDQLRSYGMIAELLSVIAHLEGTIRQGAIDRTGIYVLTGTSSSSSGTTPNQVATTDFLAGGDGLPYFGAVGDFASAYGANVLVGLRKCKLDSLSGWTVEDNKFRLSEMAFKAIVPDTGLRKLHRVRAYETAATIPADLNSFFSDPEV